MTESISVAALSGWMHEFAGQVSAHQELLTQLDSAIGDADHGANMVRGMGAAVAAVDDQPWDTAAALLKRVGMTLVSTVGGASGPLYGTFFLRMATAAGDVESLDAGGFGKSLRAGLEGVVSRGKAEAGDKTMFDALSPAVDAFDTALAAGEDLGTALRAAAAAAAAGRDATVPLVARKGRASYLGERSVGHQDPGATSAALLVASAATALASPDRTDTGGQVP